MNGRLPTFCLALLVIGPSVGFCMQRVTINDLRTAVNGEAVGFESCGVDFGKVQIDSRTLGADDVFWAVRGSRYDGHEFVADAVLGGAVAAVAEHGKAGHVVGPFVRVRDSLTALQDFAKWYRRQQDVLVIGVTGSVGKTTTREMIHSTLSAQFHGTRSARNFNNHIGLPLSVLDIDAGHEFAVLEMGASRVGEIRSLAEIATPDIGVVTAIGEAHLSEFGSLESIIQAKGELIESLPKSGFAILAGDDPAVKSLAERAACPVLFVGEKEHNTLRATEVTVGPNRLSFRVDGRHYELAATGRHHLTASLAAVAIGREIGMTSYAIAEGLRSFVPADGRCRIRQFGPCTIIDDTYNANPRSMQAACDVLHDWVGPGKRVLITGDMLELAERANECHRALGQTVARNGINRLLAIGQNAAQVVAGAMESGMESQHLAQCGDIESLLAVLDCWLEPGDVLLVKGSRAMRMERVIEWISKQYQETSKGNESRGLLRACA